MALIGGGTDVESAALQTALSGLSDADFARLRACYEVPGRPRGPHVSATELIHAITKTGQSNASRTWSKLKTDGFLNTSPRYAETHRFPGQRGGRPSEVVDIPTALQIIMVLPGKTAAKVRVKASVLLTRFLAGDLTLVSEVYGMNELQSYLREHHPEHPLCTFRQSVEAGQTHDLERRADRTEPLLEIENGASGGRGAANQVSIPQMGLPEPSVTWKELGARREEVPAARGILESFLILEEPGSRVLQRRDWSSKPPIRFRELAEGALRTAREALGSRASWPMQDGHEELERGKRRKTLPPPEQPDLDLPSDAQEDVVLRVSDVMREAGVWDPVWKVYQSDLSNRMLQIKCKVTDGAFSDRRPQLVAGGALEVQVHKYRKPDDWPVACRALEDTKNLYEKRLRELLEDAFVRAGLYDDTLGRACTEAAKRLAVQLRTQVGR
jgi:hypothetical protein